MIGVSILGAKMATDNELKIGLALGGGGARGLAHIGVLKVLEREGIPVSCIAGTSMGGLIGALSAYGLSSAEIEAETSGLGRRKNLLHLIDIQFQTRRPGLIRGERIYRYLSDSLGENLEFADLTKPLAVVAVDVNSGQEVVLTNGSVAIAIRATISVPAIFEPVELEDLMLVDGGILNNVPVDAGRNLGADRIIAVDVLPNFGANQPGEPLVVEPLRHTFLPRVAQKTYDVITIMISAITEKNLREHPPDILIRPDLPNDIGLFVGFKRASEVIVAGEQAAEAALPQIQTLLKGDLVPEEE